MISNEMEVPIKFAIVGCGAIGKKRLNALPEGSLVAACDLIRSRAEDLADKAGAQCRAVNDVSELLAAKPDAVRFLRHGALQRQQFAVFEE